MKINIGTRKLDSLSSFGLFLCITIPESVHYVQGGSFAMAIVIDHNYEISSNKRDESRNEEISGARVARGFPQRG